MSGEPVLPDRAVIDRVVSGQAVLLVGPTEEEAHVPVAELPEGAAEGVWVVVERTAGGVSVRDVDTELTELRRRGLEARMRGLRRDRRGGRFRAS